MKRTLRSLSALSLVVVLATVLLSACDPSAHDAAQKNKARLDHEVQTARTTYLVPESLLQPIETQESKLAAGTAGGTDAGYQSADAGYTRLYNTVLALERMTPAQARAQTSTDLQQLEDAITSVQKQGFVEVAQYSPRLQQAQQQFAAAATTKEYFQVDRFVQEQLTAVNDINPVYQQLQALNAMVSAHDAALGIASAGPQPLQCALGANDYFWTPDPTVNVTQASAPIYEYQQWPAQDLSLFRAAGSTAEYEALTSLMRAQTTQLTADASAMLPTQAATLLQTFQTNVLTYQQDGGKDTHYQQQATQDAQTLSSARTLADYTAFVKTMQQQTQAMALPLIKLQTAHDLATLSQLVAKGQAIKTIDPANGIGYPDAYEYASQSIGIGDAQQRLQNAQTLSDYQAVDQEIQMFIANIQAMLQNLNDKTPATSPHATDLSLLQHYGITPDNVIVVSLREQEARMYSNGKLVKAFQVTSGNPDLPSPPGIHCVQVKMQNYDDISPFPPSSPYYYKPTHINFGMVYSDYGFILHDAWWRSWFGKYSNLPHYDPISFNNGSHGCVNFPLSDMGWLYNWSQVGTPVILY
ncbi:MAG TPA: L,D-transpeptidase [Ktedonobacterales bacterium]|nr:L,D-transpeptidase [Ktedonobacterales bacterium]